jgi:hypothetical protein
MSRGEQQREDARRHQDLAREVDLLHQVGVGDQCADGAADAVGAGRPTRSSAAQQEQRVGGDAVPGRCCPLFSSRPSKTIPNMKVKTSASDSGLMRDHAQPRARAPV